MTLTRKRAGQITIVGPNDNYEADTSTCPHCNRAWVTRSNKEGEGKEGGFCKKCYKHICPQCEWRECQSFLEKLDEYEAKQRMFAEIGI